MRIDPTIFSDWTLSHLSVTGSTVYGPHNAVLMGGDSGVGSTTEGEEQGETSQDAEAFGAPGIVFRPRAPQEVSTPDGTQVVGAEAMAARTPDGLVPLAWRDLRFNRAFPAPKPGTVALVGYGGGFLSFDDTAGNVGDRKGSITTWYVPYGFTGGVAAKAHAIVLDPEEEAVSIVHGDGASVLLTDETAIIRSPAGDAFIEVRDGKIILNAVKVIVRGGMLIGDESLNPPKPVATFVGGSPAASTLLTVSA